MSNQITLNGRVSFNQSSAVVATVSVWEANNDESIGTATASNGQFTIDVTPGSADAILYVTADLQASGVVLLSVLSLNLQAEIAKQGIVVNELTTVAAAFTCAQFFTGLQLSGNLKGVTIAAKNMPNLVNPVSGSWGDVLTDPFNITQNETLARLNTLGALITAYGTVDIAGWQDNFLKYSTPLGGKQPENTAEAMIGIAQSPWANPVALYALFDQAYPQPGDGFPAIPTARFQSVGEVLLLCPI